VPQVIAHRGASAAAPENTLAAVELALEHGADRVEVDVRRTADGALVLLHDATPRRTTDVGPERAGDHVDSFSLAALRRLDAGSWFDVRFSGQRVPVLGELLELVRGRAGVHLELKDPARHPGVERQVLAALGRDDDVVVQSFDHASVRRLHALAPEVPVALLVEERPHAHLLRTAAGFAAEVNPALTAVGADVVAALREHGLRTSVWTVNAAADLRRVAALGVDGIITDEPALARALLVGAAH
jgi:glycerophosphoryl diester phosphodiesterase